MLNPITQVLDNLYLGDYMHAITKEALQAINVTHVLCVADDLEMPFPETFTYLKLPIDDSPEEKITKFFPEAFKFIHEAIESEGVVFAHCQAGVSRSASIVISFLMKKLNIKFEEAFLFLKVKRPHIQPNEGFVSELKAYEAALFSE